MLGESAADMECHKTVKLTMLNVFPTKETPSAIEKHREFNEPESRQNSQNPLSTI